MEQIGYKLSGQEKGGERKSRKKSGTARHGFTLVQLLVVVGLITLLAGMFLGVFGRSRASARRAACDTNLKAITMALDAFRQEQGFFPEQLSELVTQKYLTNTASLRCPSDPRPNGSYNDYYIMRSKRDSGELPILVCPLCASEDGPALQAFKGRYTKQFATRPAQIIEVSGAEIERPGKNPIKARSGMTLRGGDIIRTPDGGSAVIRFADGSTSSLSSNAEVTLLQSFIAGNSHAPLYTILRQQAGDVAYKVTHGSKFDVTTPTATAGALGTAFEIKEDSADTWWLKVTESKVLVADYYDMAIVTPNAAPPPNSMGAVPMTVTKDWTYVGEAEEVTDPVTGKKTKVKKDKKEKKPKKDKDKHDD